MGFHSARRVVSACALSTAAIAAIVVPSTASALVTKQCSGGNILGIGSSAQKLAQKEIWDTEAAGKGSGFSVSANADACNGTQQSKGKPEVKYEGPGSGAGLEAWGVNGKPFSGTTYAFAATDEPVNAAEKTEIESHELLPEIESVQSIPVLQFAVSVPMNLPTGCTATSTASPGRLVLENVTLQKIFRGEISKWSEITSSGDKLEGGSCNPATEFTRIVRLDQSGTTHVFKKYLSTINKGAFETEKGEMKTWDELSEGTENTTWPKAAKVLRPVKTGGGAVVSLVAATPSSIGYANLADVRSNGAFSKTGLGGVGTAKFWAPIENNGDTTKAPTYKDPSTNEDVEAVANSHCEKEKFVNKAGEKYPPATTGLTWNEVTTGPKQVNYPICGLTFDMGLTSYKNYGMGEAEAQTASDYLEFVVESTAGGGQAIVSGHDYEKLPSALSDIAQDGADLAKF
jgi:ABC-type phosphate transport system substrate-binding protein